MLEPLSVGLRIGMFFMLALVQIREHVPFSIDSDQRLRCNSSNNNRLSQMKRRSMVRCHGHSKLTREVKYGNFVGAPGDRLPDLESRLLVNRQG